MPPKTATTVLELVLKTVILFSSSLEYAASLALGESPTP